MRPRAGIILIILLAAALLSGCRTDLYSSLSEKDANEMLAVLLQSGIDCAKTPGAENTWTLQVEEKEIARAVEILRSLGYPRDHFASMGEVFQKEGLVSSPMEERIRFIYALSQEISATLSRIDGVLAARVHIVLPENNPLGETIVPSSASVFIKHRQHSGIESKIPQIKNLVINSIEGLSYDNVTVLLFPTGEALERLAAPEFKRVLGMKMAPDSVPRFWFLTGGLGGLLALSLAGLGAVLYLSRRKAGQGGENG